MQRLFVQSFLTATLLLLGMIAALAWWVDPFQQFRLGADGLDRTPAYTLNRSLFKLVELQRALARAETGEPLHLLLGDSMGNQINASGLAEATGIPWFNMSYGAATLEENLTLLDDLLAREVRIAEIVWSLPFTRMREVRRDVMARSLKMAQRPWLHAFTHESLLGSWYVLRKHWLGIDFVDEFIAMPEEQRIDYFLYRMRVDLEGAAWPGTLMSGIEAIERKAALRGVPISYVVIPVHPRAREIFAIDFADRYRRYRAFIGARCTLDLERDQPARWTGEKFVDAVHLKPQHRGELVEALAQARQRPCRSFAPAIAASS